MKIIIANAKLIFWTIPYRII